MHSSRMLTARSSSHLLRGRGSLPQCMLGYPSPGCGPGDPPDVSLETPPGDPPGCGPGDLQCMLGYHPQPP